MGLQLSEGISQHTDEAREAARAAVTRRRFVATGLGASLSAGLVGCSNPQAISAPSAPLDQAYGLDALKPLDLAVGNLTKITVCTRPFRPAGPRLESERVAKRMIVHNYGHGGSGWSLAWGYAEAVRDMVVQTRPKTITVLGAGAMGLTSAIALAVDMLS